MHSLTGMILLYLATPFLHQRYVCNYPSPCITPTLDIRGVGIFISNTLSATQTYFNNNSFKDHVWIKIYFQGQDKLLVVSIYIISPSAAMETSISSLCSLLEELINFTHLLICGDYNMKVVQHVSESQEYPC